MESEQQLQEILWISTGPEQTEALGEALGRTLPAGAVLALDGDRGARDLIAAQGAGLVLVPTTDPGVLRDVDHPGDLTG